MKATSALARLFSEASLALCALGVVLELAVRTTPLPDMSRAELTSQLVTASSGEILWGFLAADERWRFPVTDDAVDPFYLRTLIAYEDQRFWSHRGVDFLALGRAGIGAFRRHVPRSGGSTITMQVVRLLEPRPRTLDAKLEQLFKAVKLERALDKKRVLSLYLTLAPFGGNIEGVRAASLVYFGKEPTHLAPAEAALLTAIPQSPEARRPDRHVAAAREARNRVLGRTAARNLIEPARARRAMASPVRHELKPFGQHASHIAVRVRQGFPQHGSIPTLIERDLQRHVETVVGRAAGRWDEGVNVAAIVIRNRDAAVVVYVGGAGPPSERRMGFVDLVQAVRSPGSTLKPLIYAKAFEKLIVHPETVITDAPIDFRGYRPENADGKFLGDMTVRQALIKSRNTTAVMLLDKVGVGAFLADLRNLGRPLHLPIGARPGLAIALGGAGVSLEQLTWFYAALANGGDAYRIRYTQSDPVQSRGRLVSPAAAQATADVLADAPPPEDFAQQRALDGGRRIGFKTGTSFGFRDAWAVGFDGLHAVGVWLGRPDGGPHLGSYGATAAAPVLMQIFDGLPIPPRGIEAPSSDFGTLAFDRDLPERLRRFAVTGAPGSPSQLQISFPRDGATIVADRTSGQAVSLPLAASGGKPPYHWTLSGTAGPATALSTATWPVEARGQLQVTVIDAAGAMARSSFWLE